ncbi:MAG: hypothetical protein AB1589_26040 [Cyanobacteriota bacterium]
MNTDLFITGLVVILPDLNSLHPTDHLQPTPRQRTEAHNASQLRSLLPMLSLSITMMLSKR